MGRLGWVLVLAWGLGWVHKLMGWVGLDEEKWTHVHLWVSLRAESEARAVAGGKERRGSKRRHGKNNRPVS